MNLVILTGRLVRKPELKYSASGTAYCRFTIAVNRAFDKEKSDFISCTAFGKTAELVGEYLRKGSLTGVQGRLEQSEYEKDGKKEYKTGVTVDKIEFLESKKEEEPRKKNVNPKPNMNLGESKEEIDDFTKEFPFN